VYFPFSAFYIAHIGQPQERATHRNADITDWFHLNAGARAVLRATSSALLHEIETLSTIQILWFALFDFIPQFPIALLLGNCSEEAIEDEPSEVLLDARM
jgi:hypothetical protein